MDRQLDGLNEMNPSPDTNHSFAHYMRRDISILLTVDAIAFLPGWEASTGANVEKVVGGALALEFYDALTFEPLVPCESRISKQYSMFFPLEVKLDLFMEPAAYHAI
jgi:hypothetical protein